MNIQTDINADTDIPRAGIPSVPGVVGAAALLVDETNGFAADFGYALDAKRVAKKVAGVITEYTVDDFIGNAGTAPKQVYDATGTLVWSPHNMFLNSGAPVTQSVGGLIVGATYTMSVVGSGSLAGTVGASGTASAGTPATFVATGTSGTFTKTGTLTQIQLNRGSVPTTYLATTAAARFGLAIDYDPTTLAARGLMCEPAATNICLNSSTFSSWAAALYCVLASDDAIAPNGLMQADKLTDDTNGTINSNSGPSTTAITIAAATVYTFSVYLKNNTNASSIKIGTINDDVGKSGVFNLVTETFTLDLGTATGTVQALPNGWYRCAMTWTSTTDTSISVRVGFINNTLRDGTHSFWMWGAQMETGAVATSPIPTFAATVTRAADNYNFLLSTIPTLGTEYSIYGRFSTPEIASSFQPFSLTNGTAAEFAGFRCATTLRLLVWGSTATQANIITAGDLIPNVPVSAAGRLKLNDFAVSKDGGAALFDTGGSIPTIDQVRFGGAHISASATFRIAKMMIVPRRWSDAELQTKSAVT